MKIGQKVKVIAPCYKDWSGRTGRFIAIGREMGGREYIVQFSRPAQWSYFNRKEIAEVRNEET